MTVINLRRYYYPLVKTDTFTEVPEEVAEALLQMHRKENNRINKRIYHKAYFSLDCKGALIHRCQCVLPAGGVAYYGRDGAATRSHHAYHAAIKAVRDVGSNRPIVATSGSYPPSTWNDT